MTKSLAGKLGIPLEADRTDVRVDVLHRMRPGGLPAELPVRVTWSDGRSWHIERIIGRDEYGSKADGNLVVRWRVLIAGQPKVLYQQGSSWFVRARRKTEGGRT